MYAALLNEVDGVRLISPQRLGEATAPAASGVDEVFGMPSTWALGYSIGLPGSTAQDSPTAFGICSGGRKLRLRRHSHRDRVRVDQEPAHSGIHHPTEITQIVVTRAAADG